jgi:hypothetical protein
LVLVPSPVSVQAAREVYRVALETEAREIDRAGTAALRDG